MALNKERLKMWKGLSGKKLDAVVMTYIAEFHNDYASAYMSLFFHYFIEDKEFKDRLKKSFMRARALYPDAEIEAILNALKYMSDEDVANFIIDTYRSEQSTKIERIVIYLTDDEVKARFEKILLRLSPNIKHINLLKDVGKWDSLSDNELMTKVTRELVGSGWDSSSTHFTFVNEVYPGIKSDELRRRISKILLSMSEFNPEDQSSMEKCGRAIYACARLRIPGVEEKLAQVINNIKDPTDLQYSSLIPWINDALQYCPIPEAEAYLLKQLESVPEGWSKVITLAHLPYRERAQYMTFLTAHKALASINKSLAAKIAEILKLKL